MFGKKIKFILIALMAAAFGLPRTAYPLPSRAAASSTATVERDVTYCSANGQALKLDFYHPTAGTGPYPLVMLVHGGGWVSGDKGDSSILTVNNELLSHGIAVASVNYRFAGTVQWLDMVRDIKCAARFLRANAETYGIDSDRFGILGGSAGGHLASWVATDGGEDNGGTYANAYSDQSSAFQSLVDWYGPVDLTVSFPGLPDSLKTKLFGTSSPDAAALMAASPAWQVTPDAPPALMMHGTEDPGVPVSQSETFLAAYEAAYAYAELILVENAGHGFVPMNDQPVSPNRSERNAIVREWFEDTLAF